MQHPKTEGLVAAPFTPMLPDRTIDLDAIESYANWLKTNGIVGAFICGSTGEGMSLTIIERQKMAERWMAVAPQGLRVIVHVGHTTLADCRTLAAHAAKIGADSISCLAPFYYKANGIAGLVDWCEQVASAAPGLPFYYYHIPSMTGMSFQVHEFLQQASKRIPSLVGIKYTHEDIEDCKRCFELEGGRFDVLFGRDEMLVNSLGYGTRGAVGSTYNFLSPLYQAIISAFRCGEQTKAEELQSLAVRIVETLIAGGPYPTANFKWFMSRVGIDCGPTRLPMQDLTPQQIVVLESRLETMGAYDWVPNGKKMLGKKI